MTAKEYLSQAYYIHKMIEAKCEQLELHKHIATKATSVIVAKNLSGTSRASKVEVHAEKTLMLEEEIRESLDKLYEAKRNIKQVIDSVKDERQRVALEFYHLNFKRQWEIAEIMNYSVKHVNRILARAWRELDKKMSFNVLF